MNELQIFKNEEFGEIRTIEEQGKILFCGSDVAKALGYTNAPDALNRHCRAIVKRDTPISGKMQAVNFIPEGDVYRLIAHSKLPSAEKFEKWIYDDVLPTIHRYGAYMTPQKIEEALLNPDTIIQLAQTLKNEQEKNKQLSDKIAADKPKVLFAEAVESSDSSILIGDLAKILKQNGIEMGQKRLFEWLRNHDYLIKLGSSKNMPTQRAMEKGLFFVKESSLVNADGSIRVTKTTKVTGKGQQYFINKFLESVR